MDDKKVAFSVLDGRIAPVFDTSSEILLVLIEKGAIVEEETVPLTQRTVQELLDKFAELGVGQLVCGGISSVLQNQLEIKGISVLPFIAGDIAAVKDAWIKNELNKEKYIMPGCCGRRVRGGGMGMGRNTAGNMNGIGMRRSGMGRGCGMGFGPGAAAGFGRGIGGGRGMGLDRGFGAGFNLSNNQENKG